MNKKLFVIFALSMAQTISADEFKLLNKLNVPIRFSVGTGMTSQSSDKIRFLRLEAGAQYVDKQFDNRDGVPQLLIRTAQPQSDDITYAYEFPTAVPPAGKSSGKSVIVKLVDEKGTPNLTTQTNLGLPILGNIKNKDIVPKTWGRKFPSSSTTQQQPASMSLVERSKLLAQQAEEAYNQRRARQNQSSSDAS